MTFASCSYDVSEENSFITPRSNNDNEQVAKVIHLFGTDVTVLDSGEYYKFQGDICIPKNYIDSTELSSRGAIILNRSWVDNKVYYCLDNVPNQYKNTVLEAIGMVEHHSYLEFIPQKSPFGCIFFNYVDTDEWVASSSYLGRHLGGQNITLSTDAIKRVGTIAHEICHAIGMDHEQNRSDRDNYLAIDFSKMETDNDRYQYKKYIDKGLTGADIGMFDFESIMLYSSNKYMKKKDGSDFYGQRTHLSKTDMLSLAALQPLGDDFTFYSPLGYNEPFDTDYLYQRSKKLRCPEGAEIGFNFQYLNEVNNKTLGWYSYDDFDITAEVRIINEDTGVKAFSRKFQIEEMKSWNTTSIPSIILPQGYYTVYVTLQGRVKNDSSNEKNKVLKKLLYGPHIFLHLKEANINNQSKHIPSEFGNDKRTLTFIEI